MRSELVVASAAAAGSLAGSGSGFLPRGCFFLCWFLNGVRHLYGTCMARCHGRWGRFTDCGWVARDPSLHAGERAGSEAVEAPGERETAPRRGPCWARARAGIVRAGGLEAAAPGGRGRRWCRRAAKGRSYKGRGGAMYERDCGRGGQGCLAGSLWSGSPGGGMPSRALRMTVVQPSGLSSAAWRGWDCTVTGSVCAQVCRAPSLS